ncbi:unnamed protein product [Brassica rapa]|uniref:Uncharacterized protein n=2 Tax=Brassica TaxID=3705 RepID=A0A8D9MJ10_BRACM|nr:unnamed protein product [Brassica rapa]
MAMEACRRKTCRRRLNLRLRAREPRRRNQGPQRQQLEPRARIAITKEALGFWTVKLFRKMGCGCYCFPISEMGDACYAATCIFQVKSTMDTLLAMGAFVSARFLKFLLSTTVHNSLRVIFTVCTYAGKALWFKVRDWSLRVRDVQCMDELIFLVLEVDCRTVSPRLLTDFGFPCSKGGPQTIQNLTKQFHPSLTEEEKIKKKEGKGLKFFFLEKRFNTQPIKTRETTWSFNGSHELECSHL